MVYLAVSGPGKLTPTVSRLRLNGRPDQSVNLPCYTTPDKM